MRNLTPHQEVVWGSEDNGCTVATVLDGDEWADSFSELLLPGNSPWYPLNSRLAAHRSQFERFRKEKISRGDKCVYQRDRATHPGLRDRIITEVNLKNKCRVVSTGFISLKIVSSV